VLVEKDNVATVSELVKMAVWVLIKLKFVEKRKGKELLQIHI